MTSHPIRFGIQTPQQHIGWPDILSLWQEIDILGYDTAWLFDHFLPIFSDPTGPCLDGWTALSGLAMATRKVRLGLMVTGNTYRHPAVLAKMATTVDIISGGRLIFGIGAGWFKLEHQEYGIPFHTLGGRLGRLDETLQAIKLLWTQERSSFNGKYVQLANASFNPKPVQKPHPTILIGASGESVALKIVAQHAQMWNGTATPEELAPKVTRLNEHCRSVGRDPGSIEKSALVSSLSANQDETRRQIDAYLAIGVTHVIFSLGIDRRNWMRTFAEKLMPAYRS
jgi:F420-dependent oxidoreductase-like protein